MANIINNNFHNIKLKLSKEDYWDFFTNQDDLGSYSFNSNSFYDKCLISYIDASSYDCVDGNELNGHSNYVWEESYNNNGTLTNIGYTGFDNGLISFRRDKIVNKDFIELYQNSKYELDEELVLRMHQVSGSSMLYDYPIEVRDCDIKLNGGFYQGFFKTKCGEYEVLPSKLENGGTWSYEFVLKKSEFEKDSNKTLNDKYPENKGIFFYLGTRAENKWAYLYNKKNDECFSLGIGDYVEGGDIDVKTHKINAFLDMGIEMPIEYEAIALDDYLSYKYYNDKLYEVNSCDITYFDADYEESIEYEDIVLIDEENNSSETLEWCCGFSVNKDKTKKRWLCGCGCCHESMSDLSDVNKVNGYYFSKCELFGDDYLSDIDEIECDLQYVEDDLDISDFIYLTNDGIDISKNQYKIETDNKFLMFDRTKDGFNVCNWVEGSSALYIGTKTSFKNNLFLLMNRTKTGYTVCDIERLRNENMQEYNVLNDLYNNALAFRITDKGSIGYRYFILNCDLEDKYEIKEGYSKEGLIKNDEWFVVHVKIESFMGKMKIKFYVNGNLVFISDELPLINLRALSEDEEKQETVPFNISLGGGTQGLADVVLPNYMIDPYRVYPLEKHFAGSFIGYLKSFKMYDCNLEYENILNNFRYEINNLKNN